MLNKVIRREATSRPNDAIAAAEATFLCHYLHGAERRAPVYLRGNNVWVQNPVNLHGRHKIMLFVVVRKIAAGL